MKARVEATGEIVEVYESCNEDFPWTDEMGDRVWKTEELIFLETTEKNPDYWTRFEHQAAIAAMQGMLSNEYTHKLYLDNKNYPVGLLNDSITIAHALVENYKKEERK